MRNFSFNKVIIIQSINPNNHKNVQLLQPGAYLKQKFDEKISSLKSSNNNLQNVSCELKSVYDLDQWNDLWKEIEDDCWKGVRPIIHFICHGSREKMFLDNQDKYIEIKWQQLYETLERVNIACHNNLFITMSVCYALFSLQNLLFDEHRIPFVGMLASPNAIHYVDSKIRFTDFYLSLISNNNIVNAMQNVKDDITKVRQKIGEEVSDLVVEFSDELFVKTFKNVYNARQDNNFLKKEAKKALVQAGLPPLQEYIDEYIKIYQKEIPMLYTKIKNKKFMIDIYPEERNRYDLPESVEQL